jgi:hypothetical protein
MTPDPTGEQQHANRFKPGQSGNPHGRPRGSRNKLAGEFIDALASDFTDHGKAAIRKVRQEKPDIYIRVVASILPKELDVALNVSASFEGLREDTREFLAAWRLARQRIGVAPPELPVIDIEPETAEASDDD